MIIIIEVYKKYMCCNNHCNFLREIKSSFILFIPKSSNFFYFKIRTPMIMMARKKNLDEKSLKAF